MTQIHLSKHTRTGCLINSVCLGFDSSVLHPKMFGISVLLRSHVLVEVKCGSKTTVQAEKYQE